MNKLYNLAKGWYKAIYKSLGHKPCPIRFYDKKVEKKVEFELKYSAINCNWQKEKTLEISVFLLYWFVLNPYFTSVSVMYDLVTFMIDRNVDFMVFLTFQLLMKLGDFDLALVLIRQKSDKILLIISLSIVRNILHEFVPCIFIIWFNFSAFDCRRDYFCS